MENWYKTWFASDEYPEVYSHRDTGDALLLTELILKETRLNKNLYILDAACGNGRYSNLLSFRGYKIAGFDLSLPLLRTAKSDSDSEGASSLFVNADIRRPCFKIKFGAVLNLFTSFGYFESDFENFKFINDSVSFLDDEGCFIFDYFNADFIKSNLISESFRKTYDSRIRELREIKNDRIIKKIIIEKDGFVKEFIESVRLYDNEEILEGFSKAGYKAEKLFGNYHGKKFRRDESQRFIGFFRKC